jgi:hypothetical protein
VASLAGEGSSVQLRSASGIPARAVIALALVRSVGVVGGQELIFQVPFELLDQGTILVHAIDILGVVAVFQQVQRFDRQAVLLAHVAKRFIAERQARDLLTPIREELAN